MFGKLIGKVLIETPVKLAAETAKAVTDAPEEILDALERAADIAEGGEKK